MSAVQYIFSVSVPLCNFLVTYWKLGEFVLFKELALKIVISCAAAKLMCAASFRKFLRHPFQKLVRALYVHGKIIDITPQPNKVYGSLLWNRSKSIVLEKSLFNPKHILQYHQTMSCNSQPREYIFTLFLNYIHSKKCIEEAQFEPF